MLGVEESSSGPLEWWSVGVAASKKTLVTEDGKLGIDIARDRAGEFEAQFIRKGQKRFGGFDTKIIAMYARGMTVREIKPLENEGPDPISLLAPMVAATS
jgi:putative transposase